MRCKAVIDTHCMRDNIRIAMNPRSLRPKTPEASVTTPAAKGGAVNFRLSPDEAARIQGQLDRASAGSPVPVTRGAYAKQALLAYESLRQDQHRLRSMRQAVVSALGGSTPKGKLDKGLNRVLSAILSAGR